MKIFKIFIVLIWVVGCTTNDLATQSSITVKGTSSALLKSKCPKNCIELVSNNYEIEPYSDYLATEKPVSRYAILVSVNGINGKTKHYNPEGAYNSMWSGVFNEKITSGDTTIKLRPVAKVDAPDEIVEVAFKAEPGNEYFVGAMGWSRYPGLGAIAIKHWYPVIVNLTSNEIVYPKQNETPNWRRYCSRRSDIRGPADCPRK